ncbi:hypothetical protein DFH06DRAFT_1352328 [Mycena polygramma]|nr:hypothetical protein DFH06DRAFT_1352328 [Mycena polygramma]
MYRCDPPFHPDPGQPARPLSGQKMFLVCGRNVKAPGYYVSWPSADAQYKHVSGATLKGYYNFGLLRDAWHARCDLGEHSHPVDPALRSAPGAHPAPRFAPVPSPAPAVPVYDIDSRSPSPASHPDAPPSYDLSPPSSPPSSPPPSPSPERIALRPAGLLCYSIRVGQEGETFTDLSEARARFLALQNAGLSPTFFSAPSLARCLAWTAQTSLSAEGRGWEEEENRARRQRVASQQRRSYDHRTVLASLNQLRRDEGQSGDESDTSRTTEDLEVELGAREAFGSVWRTFVE